MLFAMGSLFLPIISLLNKNIKLIVNYLLGPVLFVVLSYSLYKQIVNQPDLPQRWEQIKHSWQNGLFWLVLFLMPLNWGIESEKWKRLMTPLEKFSFFKAFKAVLAGCSITMLTPNRIGEYGGRIMYVKEENRIRAISVTILGSISQLLITMLMGTAGIIYLKYISPENKIMGAYPWVINSVVLYVSLAVTVILLLIFFRVHFFVTTISKVRFLKSFVKYIEVVDVFSGKQLLRILFLSYFRYMVFILQYLLLLQVMQVNISMILCFWLLTLFYLMMVLAPTIGFIELPVRATAGVTLLGLFSDNILGIQAATFGIWLINLVVPAVIGSLFILGVKILKER
jgi:hypothetical protein